jgi:hypothetical protein
LAITRLAVLGLTDAGEKAIPRIFDIVKRGAGHNTKFLFGRQRRNVAGILHGKKVWQREEEAVFRGAIFVELTFVWLLFLLRSGIGLLRGGGRLWSGWYLLRLGRRRNRQKESTEQDCAETKIERQLASIRHHY